MPHLSPLKWKIMVLLLLTTIALLSATTWWAQLPKFPSTPATMTSHKFPQWPWS
uniref:ATP synthase F0 subunit 8 n=1 Tax=Marphysa victori TaxID=2069577 RepID=UPI001EE13253|nr:ATP synthase F0 subunit 8 [Marphysa victori]UKB88229.1 ATP synthase F0 subunit 8 [Marphysa victori]